MNSTKIRQKQIRAGRNVAHMGVLLLGGLGGLAFAGPTITFGEQGSLTIDYSLQAWAQDRSYTSSTDSGRATDFFLRRNRLTFFGQANDTVGFYAQLEAGNDGKGGDVDKSTYYRDAYVTIDYSDPVRFMVGRFKNTFSRENLEACLEPLTADRAEVISYTPFGGSRDTGAAVWGNLFDARFQYRFMIANGRDGTNLPKKAPRYTGRVHWSFLDTEPDYGYRGTYLGTKKVLTIGAAFDTQKDVAYSDFATKSGIKDYKASTVDIFYEQPFSSGTYTLSVAAMRYSTDKAINSVTADPTLPQNTELSGHYLKAGYMLPNKVGKGRLQFFGRSENSYYHLDSGYRDQKWTGGGANYYIDGQKLKLTLEYARVAFNKQNPNDASLRDYSQATVGLQFIF